MKQAPTLPIQPASDPLRSLRSGSTEFSSPCLLSASCPRADVTCSPDGLPDPRSSHGSRQLSRGSRSLRLSPHTGSFAMISLPHSSRHHTPPASGQLGSLRGHVLMLVQRLTLITTRGSVTPTGNEVVDRREDQARVGAVEKALDEPEDDLPGVSHWKPGSVISRNCTMCSVFGATNPYRTHSTNETAQKSPRGPRHDFPAQWMHGFLSPRRARQCWCPPPGEDPPLPGSSSRRP